MNQNTIVQVVFLICIRISLFNLVTCLTNQISFHKNTSKGAFQMLVSRNYFASHYNDWNNLNVLILMIDSFFVVAMILIDLLRIFENKVTHYFLIVLILVYRIFWGQGQNLY